MRLLRLWVRRILSDPMPRPAGTGRCQATTKAGTRCRLPAHAGPWCVLHIPQPPPARPAYAADSANTWSL